MTADNLAQRHRVMVEHIDTLANLLMETGGQAAGYWPLISECERMRETIILKQEELQAEYSLSPEVRMSAWHV